MADLHPNGTEKFNVSCPHCGVESHVQMPADDHFGMITAECGACGTAAIPSVFQFQSPHGPPAAVNPVADVVASDGGAGTDARG